MSQREIRSGREIANRGGALRLPSEHVPARPPEGVVDPDLQRPTNARYPVMEGADQGAEGPVARSTSNTDDRDSRTLDVLQEKPLYMHNSVESIPQTEEEIAVHAMFRTSFRLSQGDPDVQEKLIKWLSLDGHLDTVSVPTEMPAYIGGIKLPKRHTTNIEDGAVSANLTGTWNDLVEVKSTPVDPSRRTEIIESIVDEYVSSDMKYVEAGRPGRAAKGPVRTDSEQDPHASWIRRYIILGEPTDVPGFDALHQELRPIIIKAIDNVDVKDTYDNLIRVRELQEIVTKWQMHHPGETFIPQEIRDQVILKND